MRMTEDENSRSQGHSAWDISYHYKALLTSSLQTAVVQAAVFDGLSIYAEVCASLESLLSSSHQQASPSCCLIALTTLHVPRSCASAVPERHPCLVNLWCTYSTSLRIPCSSLRARIHDQSNDQSISSSALPSSFSLIMLLTHTDPAPPQKSESAPYPQIYVTVACNFVRPDLPQCR